MGWNFELFLCGCCLIEKCVVVDGDVEELICFVLSGVGIAVDVVVFEVSMVYYCCCLLGLNARLFASDYRRMNNYYCCCKLRVSDTL